MATRVLFLAAAIAGLASPVFAQTAIPTTIDCDDPANAEEEVCLALPPPASGVTAFAPLAAPLVGVLGLGLLAGGGGGSTTSTSSTSTN